MMNRFLSLVYCVAAACLVASGCSVQNADTPQGRGPAKSGGGQLRGTVAINGSSTVFPITQAVAEEFQKQYPRVKVEVGLSGTGGGFKKFIAGETDINDASRPISETEIRKCRQNGIEYIELKVGIDGLSVIVNPKNTWCNALTVAQLKKIWEPGSKVKKWSDLNPKWPAKNIKLYGPDTDSGTFDYFTEVICGKDGASRSDYMPSADDNVLVRGIEGDDYSLGYFGYAYYVQNKDRLKIVPIAPGSDPASAVAPSTETIEQGKYVPLARPLFLYVKKSSLKRPEVVTFLKYYLNEGQPLVSQVGYIHLSKPALEKTRQIFKSATEQ